MAMTAVKQIDAALGRYYEAQGAKYDNLFEKFCDDNGMEDDGVIDDLNGNFDDSIFPDDLDDNFPGLSSGKDEDEKREFIFNIILKCWKNPDINFGFSIPEITQETFENIDEKAIEDIKDIYQNQCPAIFNQEMNKDGNLLTMLAISKQNEFDYLLNLVDSYDRFRIKNPNKAVTPQQWAQLQDNKHFQMLPLKGMKVKVAASKKNTMTDYIQFATTCMSSFSHRCCSKLLLTNSSKINDSIQESVKIINATIDFISNAVQTSDVCPFQIDIILSTGKPKNIESNDETGDDDDEDDDEDDDGPAEEKAFFDYIGDIKAKLDKNELKYSRTDEIKDGRAFGLFLDKFKKDNKIKDKDNAYLRDKRLIALFDRRKLKDQKDDNKKDEDENNIFLYEPPAGKYTRDIPKGAVPEWGISAARTCLLPSKNYNEDDAIGKTNVKTIGVKKENDKKGDGVDQNIGCGFHANGSLLTISFHIRSAELMKAYLYFNGQIIRFMPDDIKNVFPILYNMDFETSSGTNKQYIDNDEDLDGLIATMKDKLVDKQFAAWLQEYPCDKKKENDK